MKDLQVHMEKTGLSDYENGEIQILTTVYFEVKLQQ